ncbi:MAG: hypothetical protein V2A74_04460, partial [bacterium]
SHGSELCLLTPSHSREKNPRIISGLPSMAKRRPQKPKPRIPLPPKPPMVIKDRKKELSRKKCRVPKKELQTEE